MANPYLTVDELSSINTAKLAAALSAFGLEPNLAVKQTSPVPFLDGVCDINPSDTVIAVPAPRGDLYYVFKENSIGDVPALVVDPNKKVISVKYDRAGAIAAANKLSKMPKAKRLTGKLGEIVEGILAKRDYTNLALAPSYIKYGGMHEKTGLIDQWGRHWLAKYYSSDSASQYRLEAEHYANVLGRMFGFFTAESFVGPYGKRKGIIQRIEANNGDFWDVNPVSLNDDVLASALQHHVLDWLISNHDTNPAHLLIAPNGIDVISIDKGQAFKHVHDDALSVGYLPEENPEPVWYDRAYYAIQNNQISQARATYVAEKVLTKAAYIQQHFDSEFEDIVTRALAYRDFWPNKLPTRQDFVAALVERKITLLSTFEAFYRELFSQAGYAWDVKPQTDFSMIGGAYVQPTQEFADSIKKAGPFGRSLMFHSQDIEDYHAVLSTAKQTSGGTALLWNLKLRAEADERVTTYIKSLLGEHPAVGTHSFSLGTLVREFTDSLVAYIKTVNQHALDGGAIEDGQYNSSTVASAQVVADLARQLVTSLEPFVQTCQLAAIPPIKLQALEQQEALFNSLKEKLAQYDKIAQAHANNVAPKKCFPDLKIENAVYKPSAWLTTTADAVCLERYKILDTGKFWHKTSDGGEFITDDEDGLGARTKTSFDSLPENVEWLPVFKENAPKWIGPNGEEYVQMVSGQWLETVSPYGSLCRYILSHQELVNHVASESGWRFEGQEPDLEALVNLQTKTFAVESRSASSLPYAWDIQQGCMVEVSNDGRDMHTGYEYVLSHKNTKIRYRSWKDAGVERAQQGLLTVEVRDWYGDVETIKDVLDSLDLMGVNVSPTCDLLLELDYYRHLFNIVADRNDAKTGPQALAVKECEQLQSKSDLLEFEEVEFWRAVWHDILGHAVDADRHRPKFSALSGIADAGHPYWLRPDLEPEYLCKRWSLFFPSHWGEAKNLGHDEMCDEGDECCDDCCEYRESSVNAEDDMVRRVASVLVTGSLLSTEERLRVLNPDNVTSICGMSSSEDQMRGSSDFVFTRQGANGYSSPGPYNFSVLLDPTVALRINSYSFPSDHYGDPYSRKESSFWNPKLMYTHKDTSNELMVKREAPVIRVQVADSDKRDKVLRLLSEWGYNPEDYTSKICCDYPCDGELVERWKPFLS